MEIKLEEQIDELADLVIHLENRMMPFLGVVPESEKTPSVSEAGNFLEKWIEIQSSKVNDIKVRISRIDSNLVIPPPIQTLYDSEHDPQFDAIG